MTHAKNWEWMEAPSLASGAIRRQRYEGLSGFGRLFGLALHNLPDASELNPTRLRKYASSAMCLEVSGGPCFKYSEDQNHLQLGLKKGYAFYVHSDYVRQEPSNIEFTVGVHRHCNLLNGVQTTIENEIMQVCLKENEKIKKTYPAISKNAAGVYCNFSTDLSPTEQQAAEDLVRSGSLRTYCRLARLAAS